jgi:hypothetical protein
MSFHSLNDHTKFLHVLTLTAQWLVCCFTTQYLLISCPRFKSNYVNHLHTSLTYQTERMAKGAHSLRLCRHIQPQVDSWLKTGLLRLSPSTQVKAATLWWIPGAMKDFLGLHLMLVVPIPIVDDSIYLCKIKIRGLKNCT